MDYSYDNDYNEPIVVMATNADEERVEVMLQDRGEYANMDFTGADFTNAELSNADFYKARLTNVTWPEWWFEVIMPRDGVDLSINQMHDLNDSNPIPQDILDRYGDGELNEFIQRRAWDSDRNLAGGKKKNKKVTRRVRKTNKKSKRVKRRKTNKSVKRRYRK